MSQSNRYHGYSRENGEAILGAFFLVKERQIVLRTIGVSGSALVALRRERNARPSGARKRVRESPVREGFPLPCGNVGILKPTAEGRLD